MTKPKTRIESEAHRVEQEVFNTIVELKQMLNGINVSKGKGAGLESWAASVGFSNWVHKVAARVNFLEGAIEEYRRATYFETIRSIFQRAVDAGELALISEAIINNTDFDVRSEKGTVKIIAHDGDIPF